MIDHRGAAVRFGSCFLPLLATSVCLGAGSSKPIEEWNLCHAYRELPPPELSEPLPGEVTKFSADSAETSGRNTVIMIGNAKAIRDGQLLRADTATYDKSSANVQAEGDVEYAREGLIVSGSHGTLNLDTTTGRLDDVHFRLFERHARGSADSAVLVNRNVTVLERAVYTTCDNDDWLLKATRVRLDQASGMGTARNVSLSFMGVPFLYSPWLSFPIDDRRKSGFLAPSVGQSSTNGVEIAAPYYLNLDPQFDATLTPRLISRRGVMLGTEFRYLTTGSEGVVSFDYLPDDRVADENRSFLSIHQDGHPTGNLTTDVDYNLVSDPNYFHDFGNRLSIASTTHLDQHASVAYQAATWMASAAVQAYQTIDRTIPPASRPYEELPILAFSTQRPEYDLRPNYRLVTSYVDFQQSEKISGQRLDLQPSITLPVYSPAAYIQPTITLRHTRYLLSDQPAGGRDPQRTLPILTVDSGVAWERDARWGGLDLVQTLEPRLFYLRVPFKDQSKLPLFDTGLPDFTFSQLFRDNRFNGSDRIGDANQLTAAVITRLLESETGRERIRAGIGRIYYFQDRKVTLGGPPETAPASDTVAELSVDPIRSISASADLRQSEETGKIDMAGIQVRYAPARRSVLNLAYRFREGMLDQTDVTLLWPLGPRWHVIARRNYSFLDHEELETLGGVEYQTCCWRALVAARSYVNAVNTSNLTNRNRMIYVQLDLTGLTTIGNRIEDLLGIGILGE
jgi:LPS-assembly protein